METLLVIVGALIAAFIGYAIGCVFKNNRVGARFVPKLWACLGLFFGLQGLLIGIIY